jgi:hypothetical protein
MTYRVAVYSERGLFLIDLKALSVNEAERLAVHHFLRSSHRDSQITKITVEAWLYETG